MDLMNFILAITIIIIALQYGQTWIVFAIIVLSILTLKSLRSSLALVVAAVAAYFLFSSGDLFENFPLILVGLLIVGVILGIGNKPSEPAQFPGFGGGGYEDLLGGGGGEYQ